MIRFLHKRKSRHLADEDLMQRVAEERCEWAFDELYQRYAQRLMGFFYRMYHQDRERAADDCQETFMKVWHMRHQYNADLAFCPWLYTIAYNISRSYFRHAELQEKYTVEQSLRYEETNSDDSELKIDQETMRKALSEALERLPSEQRTLFALRYEEELTVAQVSQILDMPEGTVKSRLHRMLNYLKHELKDYERI